jgi:hypothetical protein
MTVPFANSSRAFVCPKACPKGRKSDQDQHSLGGDGIDDVANLLVMKQEIDWVMGVAPKFIVSASPEERRALTQRMPTPYRKSAERGGEAVVLGVDGIALLQRVAFGEEHEAAPAKASQHY